MPFIAAAIAIAIAIPPRGGNGCPPDRRARPALRAHVCRSQETGCVIGTALVQNHGRYEASPHAHTHLPAFLIGVCTGRLSWSCAHGFTQEMLECIRGQLQPSHRLSRLAALALTPGLLCAQVRTIVYMEQDDHLLQLQTLGVPKADMQ